MHPLDNPAWSALTTHQAHLALGDRLARRYPEDIAPIAALSQRDAAAFDELAGLVPPGDSISLPATLDDLGLLMPSIFRLQLHKILIQMVCERRIDVPPRGLELAVLDEADIPEMVALAALTHPGPFRPHTHRLGTYLGIRVDGRLAAMGGQRMHLPGYREISAVCTHPDFLGRGYARTIVQHLVEATFDEGLVPFLHVEEGNERARALYTRLGFAERTRRPVLVLEHLLERPA